MNVYGLLFEKNRRIIQVVITQMLVERIIPQHRSTITTMVGKSLKTAWDVRSKVA